MIIISAWPKGINNKIINIDPMVIPKFFVFIMFYFYLLLLIITIYTVHYYFKSGCKDTTI